jgi:hypothetical protein
MTCGPGSCSLDDVQDLPGLARRGHAGPRPPWFDAGSLQRGRRSAHVLVDRDSDPSGPAAHARGVPAALVESQIVGQLGPRCGSSGRRHRCSSAGRCFARFVVALTLLENALWSYHACRRATIHPPAAGVPRTSPTATHRNPDAGGIIARCLGAARAAMTIGTCVVTRRPAPTVFRRVSPLHRTGGAHMSASWPEPRTSHGAGSGHHRRPGPARRPPARPAAHVPRRSVGGPLDSRRDSRQTRPSVARSRG